MYLIVQTFLFCVAFGVLLAMNAIAGGPRMNKDGSPRPLVVMQLLPLFGLANGAWYAFEVWRSRPDSGFIARSLWSLFAFIVADFGFMMMAGIIGSLVIAVIVGIGEKKG